MSKAVLTANIAGLSTPAGYRRLVVDLNLQGDLSDAPGYFDNDADDHGQGLADLLARALAPAVSFCHAALIDTAPVDTTLQLMALGAARWLLGP